MPDAVRFFAVARQPRYPTAEYVDRMARTPRRSGGSSATYLALVLLLLGGMSAFVVWLATSGVASEVGTELAHRWLRLPDAMRTIIWAIAGSAALALAAFGIRRQQRIARVPAARREPPTIERRAPSLAESARSAHREEQGATSSALDAQADVDREKYGPKPAKQPLPESARPTQPPQVQDHGAEVGEPRPAPAPPRGPTRVPVPPSSRAPATISDRGTTTPAPALAAPPPAPNTGAAGLPAVWSAAGPSPAGPAKGAAPDPEPTPKTAPLAAIRKFVFGVPSLSTKPTTPTGLADRLWYPRGRAVRVGSDVIPDGMLYVGEGLASVGGGFATEAALLDPKLPRTPPPAGVTPDIPYWPNYAGLSPEARGYYVRWLLGGRHDPATPVGYIFLFFYGIERRLLADAGASESARAETPALLEEVERLLTIYGQNRSFHSYATNFLNAIRAQCGFEVPLDPTSTFGSRSSELSLGLRIGVGRFIAAARPIPAEWAFAWVCGDPETRLGTVARRCHDELRELFIHRYATRFGVGMTLEPNKTRLTVEYRCASPSFAGSAIRVGVGDLPDVAALSKPVNTLRKLLENCVDDLEGLSRLVGRSPGEASSIRALALLPKELLLLRKSRELAELRAWLERLVPAEEPILVAARELFTRLALDSVEIKKADATESARLLEHLGFGFEPDVRFGARVPKLDEPVAIFRRPQSEEGVPTGAFQAATVVLRLVAEVAASDADINEAEQQELEAQLERALDLDPGERRRLRAHLKWLIVARPGFAGLKKHLERLDTGGRLRIAQYAVAIAAADGHVDSAEIKTLQKIYRALELEPDQVFAHVHDVQAMSSRAPTEPVTIREAEAAPSGFRLPDAPPIPRDGVLLDRRAIERKLAETAEVSSLLSRIFVDDESTAAPTPMCAAAPGQPPGAGDAAPVVVAGLDEAGTALLRVLADLHTISRSDFETLAAERGMLPDGAIESMNEAAFQRCDEPLLEGDDPIEVNADVIKEMLR